MRKFLFFAVLGLMLIATSCTRVAPNYQGVLMENYGKNGKEDFSLQIGRVWTLAPGTELFQIPLWEQRADFGKRVLHLKASDNTAFSSRPLYSYKVIKARSIDVVFNNKQLGAGDEFMIALEDNILETKIYDLMKKESRKYTTDSLMADGGSLRYENSVQELVRKEFNAKGLKLMTFSCQLAFTKKVTERIDKRNQVSTNVSVLEEQIIEQAKKNELAILRAQENINLAEGLTDEILMQMFIDKWDGKAALYGESPVSVLVGKISK